MRPSRRKVVRFLIGIAVRGLLLTCGVTLFVAVAASRGQVLDTAWQILAGI